MKLADFNSLAEAQAYTETKTTMLSNKTMSLLMRKHGLLLHIHDVAEGKHDTDETTPHPAKEQCLLAVKTLADGSADGQDWNFIEGHPKGDMVIADLQVMIDTTMTDKATELQALLDECKAICNQTIYPYADLTQAKFDYAQTEVVSLPTDNSQHVVEISIAQATEKPEVIKVQQRFGPEVGDLTQWHDCAQFSRVQYPQEKYKATIPASPAAYRELRIVSPVTIGVSVA